VVVLNTVLSAAALARDRVGRGHSDTLYSDVSHSQPVTWGQFCRNPIRARRAKKHHAGFQKVDPCSCLGHAKYDGGRSAAYGSRKWRLRVNASHILYIL
jgi:hypothetical protein